MTVCLFVPPFKLNVYLEMEFYNLVNGPVDNIVVRLSRVPGEREKKEEKERQDR